ncbi:MAG: hypothetical protein M3Q30_21215 [Actinomycetota bacterium]|nr:hypothetical protein [Actinomycetota bacterium]
MTRASSRALSGEIYGLKPYWFSGNTGYGVEHAIAGGNLNYFSSMDYAFRSK